jgi:hypothetical protein
MKRLVVVIAFILTISAWIPLLVADHYLRKATHLICTDQAASCTLIQFRNKLECISFFVYDKTGFHYIKETK